MSNLTVYYCPKTDELIVAHKTLSTFWYYEYNDPEPFLSMRNPIQLELVRIGYL